MAEPAPLWRSAISAAAVLAGTAAAAQNVQPMGRWAQRPADPCRAQPGGDGLCDAAGNWVVDVVTGGKMVHTPAGLRRLVPPTVVSRPRPRLVESDAGRWSVVPGEPCVMQPLPPAAEDSWCSDDGEWQVRTADGATFVYRRDGTTVRQQLPDRPPRTGEDPAGTPHG